MLILVKLKKYCLLGTLIFFLTSCGKLKQNNPHDPAASNFEGPKVTIINPKSTNLYGSGFFSGTATDPQDGIYGPDDWGRFIWTSDKENIAGKGNNKVIYFTVKGKHTITLSVADNDGNVGIATIIVNIK